jgi:hypothetical protein
MTCSPISALILNAAANKGIKWSPYSVKRALEQSAQTVPNAEDFAQGFGLVQVLVHTSKP